MLYFFARAFDAVAMPSSLILLCCVIGLILTLRRSGAGRGFLIAGLCGLVAFGVLPVSAWLMRPLESRFPVPQPSRVDGVIVLGGAISLSRSIATGEAELNEAAGRMTTFAMLARRYPAARLLFTGGSGRLTEPGHSEAAFARRLFEGIGVRDVRYESESRNTRENAVFGARLMQPKPGGVWLLVTSAVDLPRAVGAFRGAGWKVIGYPADRHATGSGFFPGLPRGLANGDWAVHEWIGLFYYRLRGWTPALFPAPQA